MAAPDVDMLPVPLSGANSDRFKNVSPNAQPLNGRTDEKDNPLLREAQAKKTAWLKQYNDAIHIKEHAQCGVTINPAQIIQNPEQLLHTLKTHTNPNRSTVKNLEARLSLWINTVIFRPETSKRNSIEDCVNILFSSKDLRTAQQIQEQHSALRSALDSLKQCMEAKNMFRDDPEQKKRKRFECVQKNLDSLYVRKLNEIDLRRADKSELSSRILNICSVRPSTEAQQAALDDAKAKYSAHANVLEAILDKIATLGIVRINGCAYEPIYTPDHQFTYTYQLWGNNDGDLEDLVMRCASPKDENPELWGAIFDRPGIWSSISRILTKNYDARFPIKIPQMHRRSFRNGFYDNEEDRFYAWNSPVVKYMEDLCCCLYIDDDFKNDEYEYTIQKDGGWRSLSTPELDAIPKVQGWSAELTDWWLATLGRMLFKLGSHEKWDRVVFQMGRAGCGKGTSIRFWMSLFPPEKVGVINDNCEKVFGLESLESTWAWTAIDVGSWQGMNQKVWNIMAEGGPISIARKNKVAKKKATFDQHGAIASNRILSWPDVNGEFIRRVFPFFYSRHPGKLSSDLFADFLKRRPISLKKICCAYREKFTKHGWMLHEKDLPDELQRNLQVIQQCMNPLVAFLDDPIITLKEDYYTDLLVLKKSYGEFATRRNMKNRNFPSDESLIQHTLEARGCKLLIDMTLVPPGVLEAAKKADGAKKPSNQWVKGCCITELEHLQMINQQAAQKPLDIPI